MPAPDRSDRRRPRSALWVIGPLALGVATLAYQAISAVLRRLGHPGAALDDAYIHFQYARTLAQGHPLQFQAGAPITSGCTSMLWPIVLAPFWLAGARGEAILWPAWLIAFLSLGALAWEAYMLTLPLAGRVAAIGASTMTLSFAAFTWCAASGMEVVPFAWIIARSTRRSAQWAEAHITPSRLNNHRLVELIVLAWLSALLRPEGAITALFVGATLACFPHPGGARPRRSLGLAAAAAIAATPLLLWTLTGSPRSTTAVAKLLPGNPYYVGSALVGVVAQHARLLVGSLLNGEAWSAEFIPHGGAAVAIAGLVALAVTGVRSNCRWRSAGILLLALTMFAPCFYSTFLWNRLRYLWPFATGWIVGLACLARLLGDILSARVAAGRHATGIACGLIAGLFASKLEWTIDDVAQSASGIDRQQVALGRWARESLPPEARIGVNDTGAIAYFGDRRTFDIVGLTTRNEAQYWVAGVGSRFEHYERLSRTAPGDLPTHFIVYPEWMGLDVLLGEPLHEAVVTDSTILGGHAMRAYVADWSRLGSGEEPWSQEGDLVDSLDVADLESEQSHDYQLFGARDGEEVVHEGLSPRGVWVVDGGRSRRIHERFVAHLPRGVAVSGIARLQGPPGTRAQIRINGAEADVLVLADTDEDEWVERSFRVPTAAAGPQTEIELRLDPAAVTVFHYWFVAHR